MQTKQEIMEEIEKVRERLNNSLDSNGTNRIPSSEIMELSEKMDKLLNALNNRDLD